MAGPDLPLQVPADVRQGSEDGYDTQMPGKNRGMTQTHKGRGRQDLPLFHDGPKGHMVGNEDLP